jgi:hypothetical protein
LILQYRSKTFPVTGSTPDIRITPVAIDATSTDGILFEVKDFRIRHAINNLSESADLPT